MQKKFITNLALVLILNLLIKPFWILGVDRGVQNAVGSAEYGFYYALLNFSFLFNILLDLGITSFNNRNISQNNQLLNKHLSSIIVLRLLLACFYLCITLLAGYLIGYSPRQLEILTILGFNQVLISFILYLRSNLAGLHLFKTDSFISVMDRIIMIALCGFLLWGNATNGVFKIIWFVWAQTISYVLTGLITLFIVIDKARLKKLSISKAFFLMILKKSYPFAILVLLMTFYNRIDSVMLERMLPEGSSSTGIYASAYRLLDSVSMIAFLFAGLLLPIFSRMIKQKLSVEGLVRLSYCLLVIPAITLAISCSFFHTPLMALLYQSHVSESGSILSILMFSLVPVSTTYIFGTLLTANGNLRMLNIVAFCGMVLNIVLNLILIPRYQIVGAAASSLITQTLTCIAQIFVARNVFSLHINYKLILKSILYVLICYGIFHFILQTSLDWRAQWMIGLGVCLITAFFLRLINPRYLFDILQTE